MKSLSPMALLLFSLPSILSSVLGPLASVVDTALIGKLDTQSLAALAICSIILNSFSWMFNFLVHTSTQAIAASLSESNDDLYRERLKISLILALGVGVISGLFLYSVRNWLYLLAGSSSEFIPLIDEYFLIRVYGHVFSIMYMTLLSILRGQQRVGCSFLMVAVTTLVNILLTWILLYHFNTGIAGAALGTVVADVLGFALCSYFLFGKFSYLKEVLATQLQRSTWLHFGKNSWNLFGRSSCLTVAFFLSTRFASQSSTSQLAAHQILLQLWLFSSFFIDGVAITGNILGAKFYTQNKLRDLKVLSINLLLLGSVIGVFFSLLFLMAKGFLFELFTNDEQVIFYLDQVWPLIIGTQIINALAFVYDGILFGHGSFAFLRKHIFMGVVFFYLPLATYGLHAKSILWIWWGLCLLNLYRLITGFYKTSQNIVSKR